MENEKYKKVTAQKPSEALMMQICKLSPVRTMTSLHSCGNARSEFHEQIRCCPSSYYYSSSSSSGFSLNRT
ncbi:hypothetical protein E2C01_077528 [Portunus trituberculatus]|uniref:Uncharacterized protein n=1 Tax=Portunus trituberculatus TaxID=210409 RepID=A0A5B7IG97_PORTR|nr:hypothetical protein [Portunus trituberculatus]